MFNDFHITLLIIFGFLLVLAALHTVRWTAVGLKHGWPAARAVAQGGEAPPPPDVSGERVELGKGGGFDGRWQQ